MKNLTFNNFVIVGGAARSIIAYDILATYGYINVKFMNNYVKEKNWGNIKPILLGEYSDGNNIEFLKKEDTCYFVATGDNKKREEHIFNLTNLLKKPPINIIHKSSIISNIAKIGHGNLFMPNAVINCNSKVGNGTIINTGAIIEHDNIIEDYVQMGPNATTTGYVKLKKGCFLSANSTIIPNIIVGQDAYVAAGSVVTKNIDNNIMVAGIPAKKNEI